MTTNAASLNRYLFLEDNLLILKGIDSESVDLIATDPPFNKGVEEFEGIVMVGADKVGERVSYRDVWTWGDVQTEWTQSIREDHPNLYAVIRAANAAGGEDMGAFLCWLGVRVLEMHRVLKRTGSLYMHMDDTASAWVKALLDAVFGRDNFRNAVVWKRTRRGFKGSQFKGKRFNSNTDTILFYVKTDKATFDQRRVLAPYEEGYFERAFRLEDSKGRYYLDLAHNRPSASPRPNLCYEYRGYTPPSFGLEGRTSPNGGAGRSGRTCGRARAVVEEDQAKGRAHPQYPLG